MLNIQEQSYQQYQSYQMLDQIPYFGLAANGNSNKSLKQSIVTDQDHNDKILLNNEPEHDISPARIQLRQAATCEPSRENATFNDSKESSKRLDQLL